MSNLLDRIATLNINVIRCVNEHPLKAYKYLNGSTVRVVLAPVLDDIIYKKASKKSIVEALKEQFKGRLHETDLCQVGFFNFNNLKLGWLIQAVFKDDESVLSKDVFCTKSNVYWVILGTARSLNKYHQNRIQLVKKKENL